MGWKIRWVCASARDTLAAMNGYKRFVRCTVLLAGLSVLPGVLFAETAAMQANRGFPTIKEILARSCSACHDWTGSYDSIVGGGRIIAGAPEQSLLYQKIATDEMPMDGAKLPADEKAFIKGWIAAGATSSELPIAVPAAEGAAGTGSAEAGARPAPAVSTSFLGFPNKATFHAVTGFTSSRPSFSGRECWGSGTS